MKSIKNQLMVIVLVLVMIPFIISNVIGYLLIAKGFQESIEQNNKILSESISDNVSAFIQKAYSTTEEITHVKSVKNFEQQEQKEILEDMVGRHPYFDLLYIQGTDGMQTARSSGENGDRSGRWWFKQIMGDKQPFVSKSYYSVNGNVPVTSIILPIYNEGDEMIGVMGSDIKLDALQAMVEKFSKNQNSYVYILDGEGVTIAHPDKNQVSELYNYKTLLKTVLKKDDKGNVIKDSNGNQITETKEILVPNTLKEITERVLRGETGVVEYVDNNGDVVISAYSSIDLPGQSNNWGVITVEKKMDAMAFVFDYLKKNIVISLSLIIVIILLTYYISNKITRPIIHIVQSMEKASKGDITVSSNYKSSNEIGRLSSNFTLMMSNIKELMLRIHKLGKQVESSSKALSEITEKTATSIEEVSKAVVEVAEGANELAKDAEDGVYATVNLAEEIDIISEQIEKSKDYSEKIYKSNSQGLQIMELLANKTEESNKVGKKVTMIVNELNDKTSEINEIVDTIVGISEQTNLLALNAAIEAARAGEAGRGFNVVAEEIRKLSENTNRSSNRVKSIIKEIQEDVIKTQDAISISRTVSQDQSNAVDATRDTFSDISKGIKEIVAKIDDISEEIKKIKDSKDNVISVIHNVSAISEETAASSEEASASIQEQNAAAEQVGSLAEELYKMSTQLEIAINMFKLE